MKKYLYLFAFLFVAATALGFAEPAFAQNTILSRNFYDDNGDGTVDRIRWTIDENLVGCTYDAADWSITVTGGLNISSITGISCSSNNLDIAVVGPTNYTGQYTPTISYTDSGTPGSVLLFASGPMTAKTSQSANDLAAPTIRSIAYYDADFDGKVDRLYLTFTENVDTGSFLSPNDLSITNDGDFNGAAFGTNGTDVISALVSGVYVDLGTEASVIDTNNTGTFALTSQNSFSLVDGSGNTNSTTGLTFSNINSSLTDATGPIIESAGYDDVDADGKIDALNLTFSEAVDGGFSTLSANDLLLTSVGDFTGASFGTSSTNLFGNASYTGLTVPFGTESSVVSTSNGGSAITFSTQNSYALFDATSNLNSNLAAQSQVTVSDQAAPAVVSVTPLNNATNVARTTPIVMNFSEVADTGSITFATSPAMTFTTAWSNSDTTVTLTPTTSYSEGTLVTATLSTIDDVASVPNTLTSPYVWSFTTTSPSTNSNSNNSSVRRILPSSPSVQPANPSLLVKVQAIMGLLKKGMNNEWVKTLQTFLNLHAQVSPLLVVDGAFGPKTDTAVKMFQSANGLVADGIVGPMTLAEMKEKLQ